MKVFVSSVGEVNARRPMLTCDMAVYMKAVAGKNVEMDVEPSMTLPQFSEAAKTSFGIGSSVPVSRIDLMKGKTVLKGSTIYSAGITENSIITVKFVYNYGF